MYMLHNRIQYFERERFIMRNSVSTIQIDCTLHNRVFNWILFHRSLYKKLPFGKRVRFNGPMSSTLHTKPHSYWPFGSGYIYHICVWWSSWLYGHGREQIVVPSPMAVQYEIRLWLAQWALFQRRRFFKFLPVWIFVKQVIPGSGSILTRGLQFEQLW